MEKIKFQSEDGIIEFFVEEQTTVAGITYLLVSDSQDDEELAAISKVFEQMLDDVDLEV